MCVRPYAFFWLLIYLCNANVPVLARKNLQVFRRTSCYVVIYSGSSISSNSGRMEQLLREKHSTAWDVKWREKGKESENQDGWLEDSEVLASVSALCALFSSGLGSGWTLVSVLLASMGSTRRSS